MPKLTVAAVRAARHPGTHGRPVRIPDGNGLYLQITPGGSRSWVFRYVRHGRERHMGLGAADLVSLAEARRLATEARRLLADGRDPIEERRAERRRRAAPDLTFAAAARALLAAKRSGWRNAKHAAQWAGTLETYAFPGLGALAVEKVETAHVLEVLRPVWTRAPETAQRLRQRIEAVLDFATAHGWLPSGAPNPARWRGHLAALLPPPRKVKPVRHHPALPWAHVPAFWAALAERPGIAAAALRFAILTAQRSGAVRLATWAELDLDAAIWTIPAAHMKAGRSHRAPLQPAALAIVEAMRPFARGPGSLVFPGAVRGQPLSDMSLSAVVRGMSSDGLAPGEPPRWRDPEGRAIVPHGFRSTFRDWTRASGWPDHLGELALAHADKDKVRAAYARGDLLEERRPMMAAWAAFVAGGAVAGLPPAVRAA
jgi:integrase